MERLVIETHKKREILDITDQIHRTLQQRVIARSGICFLNVMHTTAALTTADLDPGTDLDMLDAFEEMVPHLRYRHPHNPEHVPDHILSTVIGTALSLPYEDGELILGTWQRVILVELDGPRRRQVVCTTIAEQG
jgi:secondary thiamine-phosphate synthase enzyme